MTRGKLIIIEGTDCSGKETQTNLLIEKLREENIKVDNFSFPNYNSATGKIIGGAYLGKPAIGPSYFKEGAINVDPKVISLYYAADRLYNIDKITFLLENGANVILDRYIYSNMAHQGGKIENDDERLAMYDWLEELEFGFLKLPKPDIAIFLHMPTSKVAELREGREEECDEHERDNHHLESAEKAYLEIANKYNLYMVECTNKEGIRAKEDINNEIYKYIISKL